MTVRSFPEERVLAPRVFEFILGLELRRAVRSQAFLTLVTFDTVPERRGPAPAPDDVSLGEITHVVGGVVRETDLVGHCDERTLAIVLFQSDFEHSIRVIDRLIGRLEDYRFLTAVRITIGAAAYPDHAVDLASLKHEAMTRPMAILHRGAGTTSGPEPLSGGRT